MARNPVALFFPCHRVVDASGALHNYGYGVEVKARILEMEGYVKDRALVPLRESLSNRGFASCHRNTNSITTSAAPSETYE